MVVGGLPSARADHAEAVARVAPRMRDAVAEIAPGAMGPLSSRMESHGLPGAVQVTARTAARLAGSFRLESRGTIEVKGKGPMQTFLLSELAPGEVASGS